MSRKLLPPPRPHRLRSSSGAFDLPSILVGVVVIGILTAGVLAAIFGVIPWAQDNAAKQDLAAINTAQGVTYAKDGQTYKDLAGLEDAGLVSGLNADKTGVTVSGGGKAFAASAASGSGKIWCITHDDTEPRECVAGGAPGGPLMAVGFCTDGVVAVLEESLSAMETPIYVNWYRWNLVEGYEDYETYGAPYYDAPSSGLHEKLTEEEQNTISQLGVNGTWPENHLEWEASASEVADQTRELYREACATFAGPRPWAVEKHPTAGGSYGSYTAVLGSNEPIQVKFTFPYGDADSYEFKMDGFTGYASQDVDFEILDGKPLWTLNLYPVKEGWGYRGENLSRYTTAGSSFSFWRKGAPENAGGWGANVSYTSPEMIAHPSQPWEQNGSGAVVLRGKSGSTEPIVFGFATKSIVTPENLKTAPTNPAGDRGDTCGGYAVGEYNTAGIVMCYDIPGFDRGEAKSHGLVNGQHYYTYTMWPGDSGWGAPGQTDTKAFRNSGPMMDGFEIPVAVILE